MSMGKILITGATGDTGGYATEQLLQKGHQVRALVHRIDDRSKRLEDKGGEVVAGDYLDLDAMRAAVKDVPRAYFVYPLRPGIIQATAYFAQAAREVGVEAIVNMSQISARENARSHAARDHWVAERVFDWSGVAVTHLRPTFFAEWLLYNAPMIKAGTLATPLWGGPNKHAPVAAEDQARVIVGILENPAPHGGKAYPLFGPKEYTQVEIAQVLSRVLGKDVTYQQVTVEELLQRRASSRSPAPGQVNARTAYGELERLQRGELKESFLLQHIGEVALDHQAGIFAGTNDLIETIGGRPPMSLEAFIEKHRKAFEGDGRAVQADAARQCGC
jgi:NAD(P)H dehydrogenase (quinone)